MRISGLSVTEAIREIVTRNRSIYDCMKMDIINYTALAVKIQPNVERQIGKSVNLNTIVVAIKRYADSFEQKKDLHDETLLKNARLSLTESMMDINLEHDAAGSDLTDLLEKFTQITQNYDLIKIPGSFRILTEDMESVRKWMKQTTACKLVAEMPGVEKEDIHVVVNGNIVNIKAERNTKKYDVSVPVEYKVVKDSAKASYKNGILEVVFTLTKKPEGTKVEIN